MSVEMPMDIHTMDPPPTEMASQWVEVAVKKEVDAPDEEGPSRAVPKIEPVDTPLSNPPPSE